MRGLRHRAELTGVESLGKWDPSRRGRLKALGRELGSLFPTGKQVHIEWTWRRGSGLAEWPALVRCFPGTSQKEAARWAVGDENRPPNIS